MGLEEYDHVFDELVNDDLCMRNRYLMKDIFYIAQRRFASFLMPQKSYTFSLNQCLEKRLIIVNYLKPIIGLRRV